ncbi:TIGR04141 family sporadically distributed protein [Vibrio crassostreae]|uniref:DUF6119 family protein n=1 Tax=Vibrio crassostreae TaxID=246167 RepID=UPI000F935770|nr:DUF6119 family protein [Vibrio crassostreae]ROO64626.1 uncharacterized protein (TIGR04141 family) [Vibrio crassostreae]CAK1698126.1 TIGR04141 family sporadically distributed protein [Vibrio crassostreae]CAK2247667.1 TIGR04141 family sporadically distributed protein [Vibrio crassostreae]CAK2571982.1 TIGR04141 family sporadically distributed protein [Vibrio crassostreae]CAK3211395.1 TIGR04141 family sporadically distributed protein [Vibrio crassostreae]
MSSKLDKMTIFRAKDSVNSFSAIFDISTEPLPRFSYQSNGYEIEGLIKYADVGGTSKTEADYPWMVMLNNLSEDINLEFSNTNKSPSAVLCLKITRDVQDILFYVLTFGMHTSRFINSDKLVNDFGIKVAMNICDHNNLRKVNTTTHSSISTLTDRQASKGSSLDIFDINDEKEFFRAISGSTYEHYPYIKSFSGKSSITVNLKKGTSVTDEGVIDILLSLEEAYDLEEYKEKFPSYGKLDYVSDDDEIGRLNTILFEQLKNNDFSNIHLSPSIILDDDISYFSYKDPDIYNSVIEFDDIAISDLVNQNHSFSKKSSIQTVIKWRIFYVNTSGDVRSMKAYDCLNCELEENGITYILSSGTWRCVSSDFKSEVETYLSEIVDKSDLYLPDDVSIRCVVKENGKDKVKFKEDVYNSYVAKSNDDIYLFDKAKINIAGQRRYEICDLLHKDKQLIHVKVLKDGTSSLSHLFVQARFYTDAFVKDIETRKSMIDFINDNDNEENKSKDKTPFLSIITESRSKLQETTFSVLLCILTYNANKKIDDLPFMAKYELANTHKYLANERGIELSYAIRLVKKTN